MTIKKMEDNGVITQRKRDSSSHCVPFGMTVSFAENRGGWGGLATPTSPLRKDELSSRSK